MASDPSGRLTCGADSGSAAPPAASGPVFRVVTRNKHVQTAYHPPDPFLYQASVVRIVTPVTIDLQVDSGFHMTREVRVQLRGVKLPDDYGPDGDTDMLSVVSNWVQAAAAGADDGDDFPLWIRTYKHEDLQSDHAEPGGDIYEADIVRKCDADNLRQHVLDKYPEAENGVDGDKFDFFRGRPDTCGDDG